MVKVSQGNSGVGVTMGMSGYKQARVGASE